MERVHYCFKFFAMNIEEIIGNIYPLPHESMIKLKDGIVEINYPQRTFAFQNQ